MFNFSKPKVVTDENSINELLSRGIENIFPSKDFVKARMLKGERLIIYYGIDPTGPSLHLGHVIQLIRLSKFQKLGHQIILLIGDFTATIGDPTDKKATRKKLTKEDVLKNLKEYKNQASKFISFSGANKALLKFNSEWLGKMNFNEVLELASNMTVQQMLERDMFSNRMKEGKPIYVHEFLYPLMQGYDSVAMNVDGEIGGNDQTFNMLAGRNFQKTINNKEKFVIATKLLVDSVGKKMGKTEENMVSLNQDAIEMYGRVMSWSDEMIVPGLEIITDIPMADIEVIKESLVNGKNPKDYKMYLARELVSMYHGEKMAQVAQDRFDNTFSKGVIPDDIPQVSTTKESLLVDVLMVQQIVLSKSEFRRLVSEGAVTKIDTGENITDSGAKVSSGVYKIGKRRFIKVNVI